MVWLRVSRSAASSGWYCNTDGYAVSRAAHPVSSVSAGIGALAAATVATESRMASRLRAWSAGKFASLISVSRGESSRYIAASVEALAVRLRCAKACASTWDMES